MLYIPHVSLILLLSPSHSIPIPRHYPDSPFQPPFAKPFRIIQRPLSNPFISFKFILHRWKERNARFSFTRFESWRVTREQMKRPRIVRRSIASIHHRSHSPSFYPSPSSSFLSLFCHSIRKIKRACTYGRAIDLRSRSDLSSR